MDSLIKDPVLNESIIKAEIDLNAIAHNVGELRRLTSEETKFMAVVKANAYGHGIIEVSKTAINKGADCLGVARLTEAIKLRKAGLSSPILVLGYTPPDMAENIIKNELIQTVYSFDTAKEFSEYAVQEGKKIKIHLKIDTGMGRLGMVPDYLLNRPSGQYNIVNEVAAIMKLSGVVVEGIFTHFATADNKDKSYAKRQIEIFLDLIHKLQKAGIVIPVKHAANSAAIIDMSETHLDMVRAGISIYGLYPSSEVNKRRVSLKPAMEFKSQVIQIRDVPSGFKISYGCTYETEKPTTIATVPVGYGDGFSRLLSSRGQMLVHGHRVPVVGRVCMDMTVLDVEHIPDVAVGDEVVIFGKQGDSSITIDEVAESLDTISYEIVTAISDRVPRVYSC